MNLYGVFILGVNIKYRLCYTSSLPYGGYTRERVKGARAYEGLTLLRMVPYTL